MRNCPPGGRLRRRRSTTCLPPRARNGAFPTVWRCRSGMRRMASRTNSPGAVPATSSMSPRKSQPFAQRVGLSEISNFAKYKVTGAGAEAWLDRMLACKLPQARPHDARADAEGRRQTDRRFFAGQPRRARLVHRRLRHCRAVSHALVRTTFAGRRLGRVEALGQNLTGLAIAGPRRGNCWQKSPARMCRPPLSRSWQFAKTRHRHGAMPGRPRQLHRRSRL